MKKRILITGGTGFAGSHLAEYLVTEPDVELHLSHVSPVNEEILALFGDTVQYHKVDLQDLTAVTELFAQLQPNEVYQLASAAAVGKSHEQALNVLSMNQLIAANVLEAMRTQAPTTRMVLVSSAEVYGMSQPDELPIVETHPLRPANPYGVSKVTQDLLAGVYARSFGLHIVIVRPFNHVGERQEAGFVVPDFTQQIIAVERGQQQAVMVGNLEARRDFSDVKDIVQGYVIAMQKGEPGEVYNIGSGVTYSMQQVVELLCAASSANPALEIDQSRLRPSDIPVMQADASKIRQLGWEPQSSLEVALERVVRYWRGK